MQSSPSTMLTTFLQGCKYIYSSVLFMFAPTSFHHQPHTLHFCRVTLNETRRLLQALLPEPDQQGKGPDEPETSSSHSAASAVLDLGQAATAAAPVLPVLAQVPGAGTDLERQRRLQIHEKKYALALLSGTDKVHFCVSCSSPDVFKLGNSRVEKKPDRQTDRQTDRQDIRQDV